MRHAWRVVSIVAMVLGVVAFGPVSPAQAAGVVGTGTAGSCTEAALDTALTGGGVVTFNCGPNPVTITVTSEKLLLANALVDGGGLITLSGGGTNRIFNVGIPGISFDLRNITLSNGMASGTNSGGAVFAAGSLTVMNSTFINNSAFSGGAIFSGGSSLLVLDSTFDTNSTNGGGGGAIIKAAGTATVARNTFVNNQDTGGNGGGAISNITGFTSLINSTFTGNSAGFGGALLNATSGATLNVSSSTVSDNSASTDGGGIYNSGGTTVITGSIVADNSAATGANCFDDATPGTIVSQGSNLSDDGSCPFVSAGDIQNSSNIDLNALADNGGATETMLPQASSDAIDNADCGLLVSGDQRGVERPAGSSCDIGSVEVLQSTFSLCVNYYTGVVYSPLNGICNPGQVQIDPTGATFCIDVYTGRVLYLFNRPCTPPRVPHVLPDNGDLLTCVSYYTGQNRRVYNHSQCTAYEAPNTIPAAP